MCLMQSEKIVSYCHLAGVNCTLPVLMAAIYKHQKEVAFVIVVW